MELSGREKYQVEAFPSNVYGKTLHTTSSTCMLIKRFVRSIFWMWSSADSFKSRLNLGNSFSRCFGRRCCLLGMANASCRSHDRRLLLLLFSKFSSVISSSSKSDDSDLDDSGSEDSTWFWLFWFSSQSMLKSSYVCSFSKLDCEGLIFPT